MGEGENIFIEADGIAPWPIARYGIAIKINWNTVD